MSGGARHLYVHLPFCAHRCGYCDFVTVVGRRGEHGSYVDALLAELELERVLLAPELDTVFLGGGTPTFTEPGELRRLLHALPGAVEVTVEANPETVTPELAALLRAGGVTRVSLGAQTFDPALLQVLERVAGPDDVRRAFYHLRDAGFDNISLDLIYGIPGQSASGLDADIDEALALGPEHLSCYELEAKPGTRFTHRHGEELARQADALEGYFERVVGPADGSRLPLVRDRELLPAARGAAGGTCARSTTSGTGSGTTTSESGWGRSRPCGDDAGGTRRGCPTYLAALARGDTPPREIEELSADVRLQERVMLGLRLDEPLPLDGLAPVLDGAALTRLERLELVTRGPADRGEALTLTPRGRLLGGGVTAELLA